MLGVTDGYALMDFRAGVMKGYGDEGCDVVDVGTVVEWCVVECECKWHGQCYNIV